MPRRADPIGEPLDLPVEYGTASEPLPWLNVVSRLETAPRYWLCTVRPDGRPHAVPVDGLWMDGALWFGGSATAVHQLNLSSNPQVVLHIEDGSAPVIVEGVATTVVPKRAHALALAELSRKKYGYAPPVEAYADGVWHVPALRVLAWSDFPKDATRFVFQPPTG
ncbi:pyridoxamine 5'-phosphate oxidase family protein [Mycetocola sp. 2940]|uniref:pyridoxamine 5'-phosphate oxidase family protein n=1 Tax=Mycetocola sp. 2940 TaxID=3156452 RepID=UPI003398CBD2